jgi:endonuclease/exonuclease/phosphatase family metal-dependent hydrolase
MSSDTLALKLATFNVKDLIEEAFACDGGDSARTAVARTAKEAKLSTIAGEVVRADPDVLGLQEVGSESLVRAVAAGIAARSGTAYTVVMGTIDARGIGCAVLTRLPLVRSQVHVTDRLPFPVFDPADPPPFGARLPLRRGIVQATVATSLGDIEVLVAHLKSRRGVPARSSDGAPVKPVTGVDHAEGLVRAMVWRSSEALYIRGLVDDLFAREPNARVALLGDFNDDVTSASLRILQGRSDTALHGVEELVPVQRRFSILHAPPGQEPIGQQIDHILLSPSLRSHAVSASIQNEKLRLHPFPEDGELPSADSDHALYSVTLR